jgi:hypothetical protein
MDVCANPSCARFFVIGGCTKDFVMKIAPVDFDNGNIGTIGDLGVAPNAERRRAHLREKGASDGAISVQELQ